MRSIPHKELTRMKRLRFAYARNDYRYVYVYNVDSANFSWYDREVCRKGRDGHFIDKQEGT